MAGGHAAIAPAAWHARRPRLDPGASSAARVPGLVRLQLPERRRRARRRGIRKGASSAPIGEDPPAKLDPFAR